MYWRLVFVVCLTLFGVLVIVEESSASGVSILTNAYAKVAKWGGTIPSNAENAGEARSNGQSFFTQSSDVNLRSGQNLKDEKVVYHYSMPAQNVLITKRIDAPTKKPGFQDRFNPPPAFQFGDSKRNVPSDHDHDHHDHNHQDIGPVYSSPKDSYNSPISSYNPVASGIPDAGKFPPSGPKYPPFSNGESDAPPSAFKGPAGPDSGDVSDYDDSNDKAPGMNGDGEGNGVYQYNPPSSGAYQYNSPTAPPMFPTPVPSSPTTSKPASQVLPTLPISHHYKFPSYVYEHPPSDYDGPGDEHDHDHHHHDHPPDDTMSGPGNDMPDHGQPSDYPNPDYNDAPDDHKHSLDDLPEYLDHDPSLKGKFNHFPLWSNLYDAHDHHYLHHPVTTTTTPPPPPPPEPADENRVNKGHYSYYYLGRKLYYIPLYFSVYFIIYITVLILKSIARHKVNFVHELDNVNKARSLGSSEYVGNSTLDDLTEQTTRAIGQFKRRYIAM